MHAMIPITFGENAAANIAIPASPTTPIDMSIAISGQYSTRMSFKPKNLARGN
jgi:hypothetical protein